MTISVTRRATIALAAAAALMVFAAQGAHARPTDSNGLVAATVGSPDPRDTARVPVPAELLGPVHPDGATLRTAFDELAAQAARSRTHAFGRQHSAPRPPRRLAPQALTSGSGSRFGGYTGAGPGRPAPTAAGSEVGSTDAGFSWRDAGIGGGVTLLLVALAVLGYSASMHRRTRPARV